MSSPSFFQSLFVFGRFQRSKVTFIRVFVSWFVFRDYKQTAESEWTENENRVWKPNVCVLWWTQSRTSRRSTRRYRKLSPFFREQRNVIEAAFVGASQAIPLVLNIGGNLIAFLSLLAAINGFLGWFGGLVDYPKLSFEVCPDAQSQNHRYDFYSWLCVNQPRHFGYIATYLIASFGSI